MFDQETTPDSLVRYDICTYIGADTRASDAHYIKKFRHPYTSYISYKSRSTHVNIYENNIIVKLGFLFCFIYTYIYINTYTYMYKQIHCQLNPDIMINSLTGFRAR